MLIFCFLPPKNFGYLRPSHPVFISKFRPLGISRNKTESRETKFLSGAGVLSCKQEVTGARCATEGKEKLSLERMTCLADKTNHFLAVAQRIVHTDIGDNRCETGIHIGTSEKIQRNCSQIRFRGRLTASWRYSSCKFFPPRSNWNIRAKTNASLPGPLAKINV